MNTLMVHTQHANIELWMHAGDCLRHERRVRVAQGNI